jgi:hypothetical protein
MTDKFGTASASSARPSVGRRSGGGTQLTLHDARERRYTVDAYYVLAALYDRVDEVLAVPFDAYYLACLRARTEDGMRTIGEHDAPYGWEGPTLEGLPERIRHLRGYIRHLESV